MRGEGKEVKRGREKKKEDEERNMAEVRADISTVTVSNTSRGRLT